MLGTREECFLPGRYPVCQASGLGRALYQWKPVPLTPSIWVQKLHNSAGAPRYGVTLILCKFKKNTSHYLCFSMTSKDTKSLSNLIKKLFYCF